MLHPGTRSPVFVARLCRVSHSGDHLMAVALIRGSQITFHAAFPASIAFQLPPSQGMKAEQTDISSRSPSEMETDAPGTVPSLASCDFIDEWEMVGEWAWSSPGSGCLTALWG